MPFFPSQMPYLYLPECLIYKREIRSAVFSCPANSNTNALHAAGGPNAHIHTCLHVYIQQKNEGKLACLHTLGLVTGWLFTYRTTSECAATKMNSSTKSCPPKYTHSTYLCTYIYLGNKRVRSQHVHAYERAVLLRLGQRMGIAPTEFR